MHVIGTAGHVDHGKTSLLRCLTGMEPSRLAEERARGMTMQLGFVWMQDAKDRAIGIVDVPGHADYRMHTIAGASSIDAFLFICACDDGWMPQSEEHLWSLSAFGVRHGVVVLTKADLVDADRLAELTSEMEVRFFEALGREVPIVPFSAPTGAGLDAVKDRLFAELDALPSEKDVGRPQMFVDRVFTVTGQGTVVTGTLRDGRLHERQEILVLPSGKKTQIRSIQSYGKTVRAVLPNARVALQLSSLSVADVPKDSQIVDAADLFLTAAVDVRLRLYQGHTINPKKSPDVVIVHGGVKTKARLIAIAPLEAERSPTWHVRLKLEVGRVIRFDERCLVVSVGGDKVLGAGRVVDEAPNTSVTVASDLLPLIVDFSVEEYLELNVAKSGALRRRDVEKRTRFPALADSAGFSALEDWLCEPRRVQEWNAAILGQIAKHHRIQPTDEGLAESALVKALRLDEELLRALIRALKRSAHLQQVGPYLKIHGHVPKADHTTQLAALLGDIATRIVPAIHSYFELGIDTEEKRRVLARFVADGKLVRMNEDHVMGSVVHRGLTALVTDLIREKGPVTAAEVRDRLQLGRKIVILLLESLDNASVTFRDGERRILGAPLAPPTRAARLAAALDAVARQEAAVFSPLSDLGTQTAEDRAVLERYLADGKLVRIGDEHVLGEAAFGFLSGKVLALIAEKGAVSAAEVRDHLQIGRKLVVGLLEAMDRLALTRRAGDLRTLMPPPNGAQP